FICNFSQTLRSKFFYTKRGKHRCFNDGYFHVFKRSIVGLSQISHKTAGKRISCSCRIKNFFQWKCRCKEDLLSMEKECAMFPFFNDLKLWTHFGYFFCSF